MKNIKKIFAGMLVATAAFGFFGCSDDTEEDDELVVSFSESGTTEKEITMTAPANYDAYDVHIAYTIDGSTPDVKFDSTAYNTVVTEEGSTNTDKILARYLGYFDYGTADIYSSENKPKFDTSVTITAIAFYVNPTGDNGKPKAVKGSSAQTYTVSIEGKAETVDSDANKSGTLNFNLASSGNTNMIHYFDTSASTFKMGTYDNCYYQIQFSYKGASKGNWYLYVRQAGSGTLLAPTVFGITTSTSKFVAQGTYTGYCFKDSKGAVSDGALTLYKKDSISVWKTVDVVNSSDSSSFTLEVSEGSTTLVDDAK